MRNSARCSRSILPILPILPPSLPFLSARSHHSGGAGDAASQPLLIVLVLVTSPALVIDGAATIGLGVSSGLTDAVEGEEKGTVDDTGAIVGLLGEPLHINYHANRGFNGVDTAGVLVMEYRGVTAVSVCAKDSSGVSGITIQGEKGTITIPSSPNAAAAVSLTVNGKAEQWQKNKYSSRLIHEFKDFERMWQSGDYDAMSRYLDTSIAVVKVLTGK